MAESTKRLSISAAWAETTRFVAQEAALLFPVAMGLIALPSVGISLIAPGPEELAAGAGLSPSFLLSFVALAIISGIGSLAVTALSLRPGMSVSEGLRIAAGRFPPLLAASFILGLVGTAGLFLLALAVVALTSIAAATTILAILAFPVLLYLWGRLSMMSPIAVSEQVGPVELIKRSWRLTRGLGWRIAAAFLLLGLAFGIAGMAVLLIVGIIVSLLAGAPEPGSLTAFFLLLIQGIVTAVFTVVLQVLAARIYLRLSGAGTSGI